MTKRRSERLRVRFPEAAYQLYCFCFLYQEITHCMTHSWQQASGCMTRMQARMHDTKYVGTLVFAWYPTMGPHQPTFVHPLYMCTWCYHAVRCVAAMHARSCTSIQFWSFAPATSFLTHVTIGGGQKSVDGFPLMQPDPGPLQI